MLVMNYRINVRNVQEYIQRDYIEILHMYKRLMTFLVFNSAYATENVPEIKFEDYFMNETYKHFVKNFSHVTVYERVRDFFDGLTPFEKEVFKDLTFYIDEMYEKCVNKLNRNILSLTFNKFYELEFIVKQLSR